MLDCQICKKVGQKVSHAAKELTTLFAVTFFIVPIVGQMVNPLPSTEKASAHHWFSSYHPIFSLKLEVTELQCLASVLSKMLTEGELLVPY